MKQVNCEFKYDPYEDGRIFYACFIKNQFIPEAVELTFDGKHDPDHNNNNVIDVIFVKCDIKKVPQGLTKVFPNMQDLSIWHSNLENITKSELAEYQHLNRFGFCGNKIETLPGDLFKDFKNVLEIAFNDNKLKLIEPNILDGLFKLRLVNFKGNPNYSKRFSSINGSSGNATLEEVKTELFEKFCSKPENIKNALQKKREEIENLELIVAAKSQENLMLEKREQELLKDLENEKLENSMLKLSLKNNISNEIQQLLLDDNFMDFTIIIDDREFRVHKFLLIARSPTLAEILQKNPYVENLNLIDISVEIFEKILKFLYFEEIFLDNETNFLELFAAAGRLKIEKLKDMAANKSLDQINPENALEVLGLSNKYESDELRAKSFIEIKKMFPKLCFSDEWAFDVDKVKKAIDLFKKKEEAIKKIEENFWSEMNNN